MQVEANNRSGEGAVTDVPISETLTAQLQVIFGEAERRVVNAMDSAIPAVLRPIIPGRGPASVIAVSCDGGLGAIIIESEDLDKVQSLFPILRQSLLTAWEERFVSWVRYDLVQEGLLGPDHTAQLCAGAVLLGKALIPVVSSTRDGNDLLVRMGKIAHVRLSEMVPGSASGCCTPDEKVRPEGSDRAGDTREAKAPQADCFEPSQELRAIFGEESVLTHFRSDDPRVPASLAAIADVGDPNSDLAIECGPGPMGHLVAVVCGEPGVVFFRDKNPALFSVGTRWGCLTVIWLRLQGPVPRNLFAVPIMWVSNGVIPVSVQQRTAVYLLQPGAQIPLTRFEEIQFDAAVTSAFGADQIEQRQGNPFLRAHPRGSTLNPLFASEVLLKKLDLVYDRIAQTFCRFDMGTGSWLTVSRPEICRLVTERLIGLAHDFPDQFSPFEVRKATVNHLVWLMQIQGAVEVPTDAEVVQSFFDDGIERCSGAELTQEDLFQGFVVFCRDRKLSMCSRAFFDRTATKRLGKTSHCLGKNGTSRGRIGWRLRIVATPTPNPTVPPSTYA